MDRKEKKLKKLKLMLLVVSYNLKFNSCIATKRKRQKSLLNYYCSSPLWIFVGQLWWSDVLYHAPGKQPRASRIFLTEVFGFEVVENSLFWQKIIICIFQLLADVMV